MKTKIKSSIGRLLLVAPVLVCFGLLPGARAVNPPPDGGYANGNTAEGTNALFSLTSGFNNSAVGENALFANTSGSYNAALGGAALRNNTTGSFNMAVGTEALFTNTTAAANMAVGFRVLYFNTTGHDNSGVGGGALYKNTTGNDNTGVGASALSNNTTGYSNTAIGRGSLINNTTGFQCSAVGYNALSSNTIGFKNNAFGAFALQSITNNWWQNNAMGYNALGSLTVGDGNVAIGDEAGSALTSGSLNVYIGFGVNPGGNESSTTRIRNIYNTIQPVVGTDPDYVTISNTGRLGRGNISSRRYKHDIKRIDNASEALFSLKPVSFRYNQEFDATQTIAYGLIAEEVAEVYPDLVGRNPDGQPENVRYEQINAMLLNEFIKEHHKVEGLKATVAQQQKGMEVLTAQLKEQASQIQNVSAQLSLKKNAPRTVLNK